MYKIVANIQHTTSNLRASAAWGLKSFFSMFNVHRLLMAVVLGILSTPFAIYLHNKGYAYAEVIDLITIQILAIMFMLIALITIGITTRWSTISRALTAIAILLWVLFQGAIVHLLKPAWWPDKARWTGRIALIWTIICVIEGLWVYIVVLIRKVREKRIRDHDFRQPFDMDPTAL